MEKEKNKQAVETDEAQDFEKMDIRPIEMIRQVSIYLDITSLLQMLILNIMVEIIEKELFYAKKRILLLPMF